MRTSGPGSFPVARIAVLTDGNATVAVAEMGGIQVAGSAKRDPCDRNDRDVGADLATARALRKLAGRLERRANGAVKQADYVRADRQRRQRDQAEIFHAIETTGTVPEGTTIRLRLGKSGAEVISKKRGKHESGRQHDAGR